MNNQKKSGFFNRGLTPLSLWIILICWLFVFGPGSGYGKEYHFTDMHVHYVNFVGGTQGFDNLFIEMEKKGITIDRVVLYGLGYTISWPNIRPDRVTYYANTETYTDNTPPMYFTKAADDKLLRDYAKLSKEQQSHIYPFLQGINVMDRNEIYYVLEMFKNHRELCGIGELLVHKGLMNNVTPLVPSANSYALAPIFDLAAQNHLPVIIHQNIADEKPLSTEKQDQIYMQEMTTTLLRFPQTTFIWAHTGISRYMEVKNHLQVLERLLIAHPNLYFDISWIVWDTYIQKDLKSWAALIYQFPDRFMLGSDKIGNFNKDQADPPYVQAKSIEPDPVQSSHSDRTGVSEEIKKYYPLLREIEKLPNGEWVAEQLASGNINRILDEITCGCKTGKPLELPWKTENPWDDPRYGLPAMAVTVSNGTPETSLPMAVAENHQNLKESISNNYYRWDRKYDYTGTVTDLTIPAPETGKKVGLVVFGAPGFQQYSGVYERSSSLPFAASSLILVDNWEALFTDKQGQKRIYPSGHWATVPWWRDSSSGIISKVRIPKGKILVLYEDEYFRGNELVKKAYENDQLVDISPWADKVKSFQFLPIKKDH